MAEPHPQSREKLHEALVAVVDRVREDPDYEETVAVYFQEPPNVGMSFPCFLYERDKIRTIFADNGPYQKLRRYKLTIMDPDPDSPLVDAVADLPMCEHDRTFQAGDLNHDVFTIYF